MLQRVWRKEKPPTPPTPHLPVGDKGAATTENSMEVREKVKTSTTTWIYIQRKWKQVI